MKIGLTIGSVTASLAALALGAGTPAASQARGLAVITPPWTGFAANAQHTGTSAASPQPLAHVHWKAPVDLKPTRFGEGSGPITHYASPMITGANTVIVPTRLGGRRGFDLRAYDGTDGSKQWRFHTDYTVPLGTNRSAPPPLPATLVDNHRVAVAGAGGTVLVRSGVNAAHGAVQRFAFYGLDQWHAHRAAYRQAVQITTPLTTGPDGSLYFGFSAAAAAPGHLRSGVARISPTGDGSWVSARALAGTHADARVAVSCAPAISADGSTGYIAVEAGATPFLVGFDTTTMKPKYRHALRDPQTHTAALVFDESSATPTIGPDGDVFYGVLGNPLLKHDDRGWLLHFDSTLTKLRTPGSFGWDQTVSVVPSTSVPSYTGGSSYLLVSKYNNYLIGTHGDGRNEIALLDPHASQKDRFSHVRVLREVRTVLSPTKVPGGPKGNRYEWCINSIAVDPVTGSAIANDEDGHVYRWDLDSGQLTDQLRIGKPRGQAYTSTLIGPDGTAYAITNAVLFAVGS